jgi:hypothetical protein
MRSRSTPTEHTTTTGEPSTRRPGRCRALAP